MEPNKMERNFKEKLEQRTIQPSDMAWDRLDAMLSVAENKKPKKNRTWMYMAAAFLVFLLVGVLFLNQEKESSGINTNNSVVTTEGEPETAAGTESSETFATPVTDHEAVAAQSQSTSTSINKISGSKKDISTEATAGQPVPQEALAANDKSSNSAIVQSNDAEKLLAASTPTGAAKKKHGVKVDPNALLSAAEEELDDSFKDKVLIGAVKNFDAVRSAVANRNYE